MIRKLNVLVACEESQTVCRAFRELGCNAFSCDLFECSGTKVGSEVSEPHPEWHFNHDITTVLDGSNLTLQNGDIADLGGYGWDIMIAHPPCTYLAISGNKWFYHPDDKDKPVEERRPHPKFPNRRKDREDGANFFMMLANADVKRIAIENPMGVMSTIWRKPDQSIQPYMFGDPYSKLTCLWLKNFRPLHPSKETEDKGERVFHESGKSTAKWYNGGFSWKNAEERQKVRSKTFPGIARGIAEQWTIQTAVEENILDEKELNLLGKDNLFLVNELTGGVRYTDTSVNKKIKTFKNVFNEDLLNEVENREQRLIKYWKNLD